MLPSRNSFFYIFATIYKDYLMRHPRSPRYAPDVKFVQVDLCPEEMGNSRSAAVSLLGDVGLCAEALDKELGGWRAREESEWWGALREKIRLNKLATEELCK